MKNTDLIFIVEDDQSFALLEKEFLLSHGYTNIEVYYAQNEALANIYKCPTLVLLDYKLGTGPENEQAGKRILKEIMAFNPNTAVLMISSQTSIEEAVESLKLGAYDYLQKSETLFIDLEKKLNGIVNSDTTLKSYNKKNRLKTILIISGAILTIIITVLAVLL